MFNKISFYISVFIIIFFISTILAFEKSKISLATYNGAKGTYVLIKNFFNETKNLVDSNSQNLFKSKLINLEKFYFASVFGFKNNINLFDNEGNKIHSWNISNFNFADTVVPFSFIIKKNKDMILNTDTVWDGLDEIYIANIDMNSKIIWKKKVPTHHWISLYKNKIYSPIRYFKKFPDDLPESVKKLDLKFCDSSLLQHKLSWYENILILDENNGEIISEIDLLDKISKEKKLFGLIENCENPLHFNDVVPITKELENENINLHEGDLIVSLNSPNLIAILDVKNNYDIKYFYFNSFKKQHAPRLTSRGTIIVYDNQGGHNYYKYGYSRIIEIDVKTGNLIGFFDGSDDIFFDSNARGYIDYIEDGIYLITSPLDFRVFVINCKKNNNLLSNKCDSEVFLESKKGTEMNIMTKVYHGNFFN